MSAWLCNKERILQSHLVFCQAIRHTPNLPNVSLLTSKHASGICSVEWIYEIIMGRNRLKDTLNYEQNELTETKS